MDDDDAGSKYAYLLNPIKDLQKNFEIDIAKELSLYLERIAEVGANEDFMVDNAHRFNFAEAAMLIQGSTAVFARKVEFVYAEATNFFQSLQAGTKKSKGKEASGDVDEGIGDDDDEAAAQAQANAHDPCFLNDFSRLRPCNPMSLVMKRSKALIPSISVMPMSLMPLADFEKCNVPIYARRNCKEVIGKKDDFKINTGYMGRKGALLLDLLNDRLIDDFASDQFMQLGQKKPIADDAMETDSGCASPTSAAAKAAAANKEGAVASGSQPNGTVMNATGRPSTVIEHHRRVSSMTGMMSAMDFRRPSTHLEGQNGERKSQPLKPLIEDDDDDFDDSSMMIPKKKELKPWELDEGNAMDKDALIELEIEDFVADDWCAHPATVVNSCVNLQALLKKREKASREMTMRDRTLETMNYINQYFYKVKPLSKTGQDDWQTQALYRFIKQNSRRRKEAAKMAKKIPKSNRRTLAELDDDEAGQFDGDMDDDVFDGPPMGAEPLQTTAFNDIEDDELGHSINLPNVFMGGQHDDMDDYQLTSKMSLQEILEFHMQRYWSTAQEATSRLAARVQEWDDKMQPLLEEEETRKEFDIHGYGNELLGFFGNTGEKKSISELLRGKKRYEISRYFLSCLMMANTYNVEVEDDKSRGTHLCSMNVTLLKRERHHEVFEQENAL